MGKILRMTFFLGGVLLLNQNLWAEDGYAVLRGTESESISGEVKFIETEGGLKVVAQVNGLTPGQHGFHIHEFGSCDNKGAGAGGHYNPLGVMHGHLEQDGPEKAHAGDLGNITALENGSATLEGFLPEVTLSAGEWNIAGRSVIVHEKADDFGQPTGNAGGRVACGTIMIKKLADQD